MTSFDGRGFFALLLILVLSCGSAVAQEFGKVFSTPQERAYLDRQREEMLAELNEQERLELLSQPTLLEQSLVVAPSLVHMAGVVRKANGTHTVWLNGIAVSSSELPSNVSLEFQRGMGMLRIRGVNGEYLVRPGQTLNADTGEVREDYELTPEEVDAVRAAVALRDAPARASSSNVSEDSATNSGEEDEEQTQETAQMINNVLEVLRLMQEARDTQGVLP